MIAPKQGQPFLSLLGAGLDDFAAGIVSDQTLYADAYRLLFVPDEDVVLVQLS